MDQGFSYDKQLLMSIQLQSINSVTSETDNFITIFILVVLVHLKLRTGEWLSMGFLFTYTKYLADSK